MDEPKPKPELPADERIGRRAILAVGGLTAAGIIAAGAYRKLSAAKQSQALPPSIAAAAPRGTKPILWRPLVAPLSLTIPVEAVDSGEVRISVTPNYADIYIDGEKRGTGRRFMFLPVGDHEVLLSAAGCERKTVRVAVIKNGPTLVSQTLTCTQ